MKSQKNSSCRHNLLGVVEHFHLLLILRHSSYGDETCGVYVSN